MLDVSVVVVAMRGRQKIASCRVSVICVISSTRLLLSARPAEKAMARLSLRPRLVLSARLAVWSWGLSVDEWSAGGVAERARSSAQRRNSNGGGGNDVWMCLIRSGSVVKGKKDWIREGAVAIVK